jgi:PTS system cellobiose-specific IIC component
MAVIPGFITVIAFAIVAYFFNRIAEMNIFAWFEINISQALMTLSQGVISIVVISFLIPLFWFFGLHGANILEAVMSPVYGTLGLQNIDLFGNGITAIGTGANELAIWVRGSWDAYVFHGGSGATLPLILAFLLFSKVREHKEIAKLGIAPGIFMINEPILFGIPIVLNPIFIIPFLLVQPILTVVAYFATVTGIAGPIVNSVPWTTPPIINAYLATNGSLGAALVALVNMVLAFIIYLPFVLVANRQQEKVDESEGKLAS